MLQGIVAAHPMAKAGMAIAQASPSTMGTLVGSGFMKAGKAVKGKAGLELADLAEAMTQFVEGVMARGKAKPGDKTPGRQSACSL
ncbi:MAG: DAK2 domain-containing protein [bacterium]|nr:DAK2 domain-containing protein [bacterium]